MATNECGPRKLFQKHDSDGVNFVFKGVGELRESCLDALTFLQVSTGSGVVRGKHYPGQLPPTSTNPLVWVEWMTQIDGILDPHHRQVDDLSLCHGLIRIKTYLVLPSKCVPVFANGSIFLRGLGKSYSLTKQGSPTGRQPNLTG